MKIESKSRKLYALKNIIWETFGNTLNTILNFISRSIFIYTLGTTYLGINSLFTNILGMLSLAELGMGSAISFSLYKPLAENDYSKIRALTNFFKKAYRIIALIVTIIGITIIPFFKYILNGAENIDNIIPIYLIFLFNTVTSYFVVYKSTIFSADQKNYIITNIDNVAKTIIAILQIIFLLIFKNFMIYLIIDCIIKLLSKFYLNFMVNKNYPYIKKLENEKLSKSDKEQISTKIKALMFHKIGEVSIYQTDNIITSAFINVQTVGLVSNFTMIINLVNKYIVSFLNSFTAGLGNMIATEDSSKCKQIFEKYDFLCFWFYYLTSICLYFLLSPFIVIWLGNDKVIDNTTIFILCLNYYITGLRVSLANIKSAGGVYEQDKWSPIIQSILNIGISIVGAKYLGLVGVYIGTMVSSIVPTITRPYVVYKYIFKSSSKLYFIGFFKRLFITLVTIFILNKIILLFQFSNKILEFISIGFICVILTTIIVFIVYHSTEEFKYVINIMKNIIKKIFKKEKKIG